MNDKITHEEEKAALILGITSIFRNRPLFLYRGCYLFR